MAYLCFQYLTIIILLKATLSNAFSLQQHTTADVTPAFSIRIPHASQQKITSRLPMAFSSEEEDNDGDDDDDDDDDDYIDDADLKPVSASSIQNNVLSFGPGKGRSAPSQRKAMGTSKSSNAHVYVCTNCSAEFVNWVGKCPTCKQWNTVQEFKVKRGGGGGSSANGRPIFGKQQQQRQGGIASSSSIGGDKKRPSSWLSDVDDDIGYSSSSSSSSSYQPVRMTDVYKEMGYDGNNRDGNGISTHSFREKRIQVPSDEEFNNVLGGGIMPGSLILLGGDPGVGKSTLLLQVAGRLASLSKPPRGIGMGMDNSDSYSGPVLYVSGEENHMQIASRAMRLGIDESELLLLCETDADEIADIAVSHYSPENENIPHDNDDENFDDLFSDEGENKNNNKKKKKTKNVIGRRKQPSLLVIDSIQTMICESGGMSAAGGVTQVRECVGLFLRLAKSTGIPILLVGHVTKSGDVAGPRTVEHMVDAVLYLEGDFDGGGPNLRMLRAAKNRFGSADEVGVYEMMGGGSSELGGRLVPVSDPSSLFLANRIETRDVEGCAISLVVEGLRPMAVEIQALVSQAGGGANFNGRRTVQGISNARLMLILAVLQKRYGISFYRQDVFINVAGGISLEKSDQQGRGSDLAIAVALVSSLSDIPVRSDTTFIDEIGLLGELRNVPSVEKRINEARRMGFSRVIIPKRSRGPQKSKFGKKSFYKPDSRSPVGIECVECSNVLDSINEGLVSKLPRRKKGKKAAEAKKRKSEKGESTGDFSSVDDTDHTIIIDDDEDDDDDHFL